MVSVHVILMDQVVVIGVIDMQIAHVNFLPLESATSSMFLKVKGHMREPVHQGMQKELSEKDKESQQQRGANPICRSKVCSHFCLQCV